MSEMLSKTKYINYMNLLTGLPKSYIKNNMEIDEPLKAYELRAGMFSYTTWITNNRIYTQFAAANTVECSWYHNIKTLEYDWNYTEAFNKGEVL